MATKATSARSVRHEPKTPETTSSDESLTTERAATNTAVFGDETKADAAPLDDAGSPYLDEICSSEDPSPADAASACGDATGAAPLESTGDELIDNVIELSSTLGAQGSADSTVGAEPVVGAVPLDKIKRSPTYRSFEPHLSREGRERVRKLLEDAPESVEKLVIRREDSMLLRGYESLDQMVVAGKTAAVPEYVDVADGFSTLLFLAGRASAGLVLDKVAKNLMAWEMRPYQAELAKLRMAEGGKTKGKKPKEPEGVPDSEHPAVKGRVVEILAKVIKTGKSSIQQTFNIMQSGDDDLISKFCNREFKSIDAAHNEMLARKGEPVPTKPKAGQEPDALRLVHVRQTANGPRLLILQDGKAVEDTTTIPTATWVDGCNAVTDTISQLVRFQAQALAPLMDRLEPVLSLLLKLRMAPESRALQAVVQRKTKGHADKAPYLLEQLMQLARCAIGTAAEIQMRLGGIDWETLGVPHVAAFYGDKHRDEEPEYEVDREPQPVAMDPSETGQAEQAKSCDKAKPESSATPPVEKPSPAPEKGATSGSELKTVTGFDAAGKLVRRPVILAERTPAVSVSQRIKEHLASRPERNRTTTRAADSSAKKS